MKNFTLLIVWLVSFCTISYGQQSTKIMITNDKVNVGFNPEIIGSANIKNPGNLSPATYDYNYYLKKSKTQSMSGIVLITSGTLMRMLGNRYSSDLFSGNSAKSPLYPNKNENFNCSGLALTGLIMMAGSIPYFIYALKNKKIAGLKFTCQKTSCGPSNKTYKKVTGLTFAIPLGK